MRPRFLGGHYSSKRHSYVKSNVDKMRIMGTKERSEVETDCKNLFTEKLHLSKKDKALKDLEKEFRLGGSFELEKLVLE